MVHQEGALRERVVADLRTEALDVLIKKSSFLTEHFQTLAKKLTGALSQDRNNLLTAPGRSNGVIEAMKVFLEEVDLVNLLAKELQVRAEAAADYRDLIDLDDLVELLDAEMTDRGHSRHWRRRLANDVQVRHSTGTDLSTAILESTAHAQKGWPRDQRFVVPVRIIKQRDVPVVTDLLDSESLEARITEVPQAIPQEFADVESAFDHVHPMAGDHEAALAATADWVDEQLAIYRLQGGDFEVQNDWLLLDGDEAKWVSRPEPLMLRPDGLGNMFTRGAIRLGGTEEGVYESLPDAFIQLAQARASSPGPALSDLWTVAEAVFAGAADEPRYEAAQVMAGLLEFLYPNALLDWMGRRFETLGLGSPEGGVSHAVWALDLLEKPQDGAHPFKASAGNADPLLYVRTRSFSHWDGRSANGSARMSEELDLISNRCQRVAARAYLVRNLHVHKAQPWRASALSVTLPLFAEFVRVCLGYIAKNNSSQTPIIQAELAMMRIRQVAEDYRSARVFGAAALRRTIF